MGLRPALPQRGRTCGRVRHVHPHLQSSPRPHRTRRQITSRPCNQPLWSVHLGELEHARELAHQLGTEHHEQVISAADYWRMLPQIIASQEEPLADPSAPALWFLAQQASQHVKAVMSGEGADELFAGYPIYREPAALRSVSGLPAPLRRAVGSIALRMPVRRRGRGFLLRGTTPLEQRFLGNVQIFGEDAKHALLAPDSSRAGLRTSADLVKPVYDRTAGLEDVARMQSVSCHTCLLYTS